MDWFERARCKSMGNRWFYVDTAHEAEVAKEFCAGCPVREPCGEYALTRRIDHGIWGGMTRSDRNKILKQRRLAATEAAAS